VIIAEADGTERYRFEGFLPADDFIAHLQLGLAKAAFSRGEFDAAQREFEAVAREHPESEAAPEAVYWTGVSSYKGSGKPDPLKQTATQLRERYPRSEWTKKASVWAT